MRSLYPEIEPYAVYAIAVELPHEIYVEECGNPEGIPILFLHGGPGSGCKPHHRQFFDPARYRIVLMDQRGTGRSTPGGELQANTTPGLVADLETIRRRLNIERWVLFGGSWGVALALAYAERHPETISGMILRGVFLGTLREVDWVFREGASRIFPEDWERFVQPIPAAERTDLVTAYHRRITSSDSRTRSRATAAWAAWTARVVTYTLPSSERGSQPAVTEAVIQAAAIESGYAAHGYFLEANQLLDHIGSVPAVPITLIHGRRDLTCLVESAWALHKALGQSRLVVRPEAGHLAGEPAMIDALVTATDAMADDL